MDDENNGKPYEQMDDLGVPLFLETPEWMNTFGWWWFLWPVTLVMSTWIRQWSRNKSMGTVVVGLGFREATEGSLAISSQVHWMFELLIFCPHVGLPSFFKIEVPHVVFFCWGFGTIGSQWDAAIWCNFVTIQLGKHTIYVLRLQMWMFPKISKMDGLYWKPLLKWMIWGYPYFWKHPCCNMLNLHLPTRRTF